MSAVCIDTPSRPNIYDMCGWTIICTMMMHVNDWCVSIYVYINLYTNLFSICIQEQRHVFNACEHINDQLSHDHISVDVGHSDIYCAITIEVYETVPDYLYIALYQSILTVSNIIETGCSPAVTSGVLDDVAFRMLILCVCG